MERAHLRILATLAWLPVLFAAGSSPARPAGTPSPLRQLDRFIGDGTCVGHQVRNGRPFGPARSGSVHGERTLDGHWVVVSYAGDRTATHPRPYIIVQYFGYDRVHQRFVTVALANATGNYYVGTGSGWIGNTLTLDQIDLASGKPAGFRDVFTTGASGMASHTGLTLDQHGQWIKTDVETCHKA